MASSRKSKSNSISGKTEDVLREQIRCGGDLLIGHDDAASAPLPRAVGIAPPGVEMKTDRICGVGPLRAKRYGWRDDYGLFGRGRARGMASRKRLPGTWGGDQEIVRVLAVREVSQKRLLPRAERTFAHGSGVGSRPPLRRLQRGHSACPFVVRVGPSRRWGVMWSACHPGSKRVSHSAQRPSVARNRATR